MIDIVIPLRNDSHWQNNEIRYCLRSVEMYLKDIRNVYIVGYKPKFIHNVIHIPTNDPSPYVSVNIKNKVLLACQETDLSEDFLFMNDDHYIMPDFDIRCLYYSGDLEKANDNAKNSIYRIIIENTIYITGPNQLFYDVHTPTVFNKKAFPELMDELHWNMPFGHLIKTMYWSRYIPEGDLPVHTEIKDGKIRDHKWTHGNILSFMSRKPVISSSDIVGIALSEQLQHMFPNKSKYEL